MFTLKSNELLIFFKYLFQTAHQLVTMYLKTDTFAKNKKVYTNLKQSQMISHQGM